MKKLLLALCVFASCKAPGSKSGSEEMRQVEPAPADQTFVTRPAEPLVANPVSVEDAVKDADMPSKKVNQANPATSTDTESIIPESRQEQKVADSIRNPQQGGGSDIEGYIPFIKQFYDR